MTRIIRIKRRSFMKSFIAINLFGIIVTCEELSKVELNHELIHTVQARELLYIPFYLWYIIEWFYLYLKYRDWMRAYYNIRFEKEAYAHQEDLEYIEGSIIAIDDVTWCHNLAIPQFFGGRPAGVNRDRTGCCFRVTNI